MVIQAPVATAVSKGRGFKVRECRDVDGELITALNFRRAGFPVAYNTRSSPDRNVVRKGDPTSHGGVVETGDSSFEVDGRAVARVGDVCVCPIAGHQNCVIIEGDQNFLIDGRAVAFDGHKTSCGATLQSTATAFGSD